MTRQNPDFGPVNTAIQQLGTLQLQVSALGFGKPLSDPVDDREIRTDANGIIWQWDETGNTWRFIGNSLQSHFGGRGPQDFAYEEGSVRAVANGATTSLSVGALRGIHRWPETDETLLRLPTRFTVNSFAKTITPAAAWSSGQNGNSWLAGPPPLTDRVLSVILIRRESDGLADYFINGTNLATLAPNSTSANRDILINGTRWRICGIVGQLVWDAALGRVLRSTQIGKTTYLDEEKARTLNLSGALTANFLATPFARCDFSIYCGPRVGGTLGALRVANAATPAGRLIGFNPMQTATQAMSFNYTAPPNTDLLQPFSVAFNVSDFQVRLLSWTEETLPKLGY